MSGLALAVAWEPMLLFAVVIVFVVLLLTTRSLGRPSMSSAFLVIGFLLGLVAVFGAENEVALPLSIFSAALLVSGAILRTRSQGEP